MSFFVKPEDKEGVKSTFASLRFGEGALASPGTFLTSGIAQQWCMQAAVLTILHHFFYLCLRCFRLPLLGIAQPWPPSTCPSF
jgi:hypothetical protein